MKTYKIKHINSGHEINEFPYYHNYNFGYGYLILTSDLRVLFFFDDPITYNDITDDYEIIVENSEKSYQHTIDELYDLCKSSAEIGSAWDDIEYLPEAKEVFEKWFKKQIR